MASDRSTPPKVICNFSACSPNRLHKNIVRVAKTALPPPFKNGMYQAPGHEQLRSFEPVARAVLASSQKRSRVQSGQSLLQNDFEELCRPRKKLKLASSYLAPAERTLSTPDIQRTPAHPIASETAAMTTTLEMNPIRWDPTTIYQASEVLLSNASRSDSQHILPTKSKLSTTQPLPPIPTVENTLLHPQKLPLTNPTNKPGEEAEEKEPPPTPPSPQKETHKLPPSLSTPINRHLRPRNHLHPSSNPLPRHHHQIPATKTHIPDADGSARRDGDESAEWVFAQTLAVDGLVWRYEDFWGKVVEIFVCGGIV